MINTLRITSVIAVILAGVFFVFPVVFGVRSNQQVNDFVSSPGVREKFEQAANNKEKSTENRASPLVQQAEAFALYLNPPKSITTSPQELKTGGVLRTMPTTTPQFKVFGTSYCQDNPELSQVFIDEPGKGRHWVRQSGKVGHLTIEQVKDGLVVVKSGQKTFELPVEQIPEAGATKAAAGISTQLPSQSPLRSTLPASSKTSSGVARTLRAPAALSRTDAENDAKLQELAKKLIDVQKNSQAGKSGPALSDAEKTTRTLELISQYKSARRPTHVSVQEAQELGDLGQTLEDAQVEPNLAVPAAGKDDAEANPVEPNQPVEEKPASNK